MRQRGKPKSDDLPDVSEWFNGSFVAVPSSMGKALLVAAESTGMTVAEYLRRAAYLRMMSDGIRLEDYDAAA